MQRVYRNAARALERVLKVAGLPTITLHGRRHTYATGLISRGVPVAYVTRQLGHFDKNGRVDIAFTVRTYGSWFPVKGEGAVDTLAEAVSRGRGHQMDTSGLKRAQA